MEYVVGVIALAALLKFGYDEFKKRKDEKESGEQSQPTPTPTIAELPIERWCYIDDIGGDSNWAQDLLANLAIAVSRLGTRPAFIGYTATRSGINVMHLFEIMESSGMSIPLFEGAPTYRPADSPLGRAIIEETKKGKLDIILGSPAQDLEWAFKNGAHVHNVSIWALLRNTWNAQDVKIDEGLPHWARDAMKQSAHYVADAVKGRIVEIEDPDYYHLIDTRNLGLYKDDRAFIESNRKYKAWDVANTQEILDSNRRHNGSRFGGYTAKNLREADCLAMAEYCGIRWYDGPTIMAIQQHGYDILTDRQNHGAVNTLTYSRPEQAPSRPPITKADFDLNNVVVEQGTETNPLKFPETAQITSVKLNASNYTIKHTKQPHWKLSKPYQAGRYIQGNTCLIFVRDDGRTEVKAIEHDVSDSKKNPEMPRPKGWSAIPSLRSGDAVGIFACTQVRSGDWKAKDKQGNIIQAQERTNIHWLTVK